MKDSVHRYGRKYYQGAIRDPQYKVCDVLPTKTQ